MKLQSYGKINLSLDVLRKRRDGYHEVQMIMQTVKLHDNIDLFPTKEAGFQLHCNLPFLPVNDNNLMIRAAKLLFTEFHLEGGLRMELRKMVPVAGGMAGGSGNAAAVLSGINRLYQLHLSTGELQKRGVMLGADIPFCFLRGAALSEGIGERLTELPGMPPCCIVLAKPAFSVSTAAVYQELRIEERRPEDHPDVYRSIEALKQQDLPALAASLGNILELVTIERFPLLSEIKKTMLRYGALNALMSGSGPTVFSLFSDREKAERCYRAFRFGPEKALARQCYLTEPWSQN